MLLITALESLTFEQITELETLHESLSPVGTVLCVRNVPKQFSSIEFITELPVRCMRAIWSYLEEQRVFTDIKAMKNKSKESKNSS